jgi:hypothetical protein
MRWKGKTEAEAAITTRKLFNSGIHNLLIRGPQEELHFTGKNGTILVVSIGPGQVPELLLELVEPS